MTFRTTTGDPRSERVPAALVVTPDEYDALPPDSRIELVDGVVQPMSPPTVRHSLVVDHLVAALRQRCPRDLAVLREQEIRLADDHRRNPDLLVVEAAAVDLDRAGVPPGAVLLAIEVVSPGTRLADRLHKPAEYAEAGIRHYWRVEPLPGLAVHTFRLHDTDAYEPTGVFHPGDVVSAAGLSWAGIPVADLEP